MTRHRQLLLDVGGSFIKCSDGRTVPVDSGGTRGSVTASLKEAAGELSDLDKLAVAIPGPFNYDEGIFMMKHKYASVYGEKFSSLIDAPDSLQLAFIHDVNCMLLGEMNSGAARGYSNVSLVAIGTGLGHAICKDGHILKNALGSPSVPVYNLPYRDGILEDYVSKRGIRRLYVEAGGRLDNDLSVKDIADLARKGDAPALTAFGQAGNILGGVMADVLSRHNIECLLFGGQISRSFDLIETTLRKSLSGLSCLKHISVVSDIDNATFSGLVSL